MRCLLYAKLILFSSLLSNSLYPSEENKAYFIEKASSLMRNGFTASPSEKQSLKSKSKEEIFEYLVADPRFLETLLNFNHYFMNYSRSSFLSFDNNQIIHKYYPDQSLRLNPYIGMNHRALESVKQYAKNGNYLSLFSPRVPFFATPRLEKNYYRQKAPPTSEKIKLFSDYLKRLETFKDWLEKNEYKVSRKDYCEQSHNTHKVFPAYELVFKTKIIFGDINEFTASWDYFDKELYLYCEQIMDEADYNIEQSFKKFYAFITKYEASIEKYEYKNYRLKTLLDIEVHSLWNQLSRDHHFNLGGTNLWQEIENTSTNFNRKRAAFVLNTYFCDDLTPIGFIAPKSHSQGKHASDAACLSCHYKLDPMAGFFKNYGAWDRDFSSSKNIVFQDLAKMDFKTYSDHWRDPQNKAKWNIGFIRSFDDPSLNEYGESIEDLYKIIQSAPEVKKCMVKRMITYFWGDKITIDSGLHRKWTEEFIKESKDNSSQALKKTLKKIILSNSFVQKYPEIGKCYDKIQTQESTSSPPCVVNDLIQNNCVQCHSSTRIEPYLDLTQWKKNAQGKYSFPHLDAKQKPINKTETFNRIVDRLSTKDPDRLMPLGRHLSPNDRKKLYLWAQSQLGEKE